jgi:hypothetical protein
MYTHVRVALGVLLETESTHDLRKSLEMFL